MRTGVRACGGMCVGGAAAPGEVEGRLPLEPPGLQVESEDLWLAVSLSPSPGSSSALRLPSPCGARAKPPPPSSFPLLSAQQSLLPLLEDGGCR